MTWNIRIYPLEREAFIDALSTHEVSASAAEIEQAEAAKDLVLEAIDVEAIHGTLLWAGVASNASDRDNALYDCSLTGHLSEDAASLSINVYRRRAETQPQQPQPAENEEAEVTPAAEPAESPLAEVRGIP